MRNNSIHNRIASACIAWVVLLVLLAYGFGSAKTVSYALSGISVASALFLWFCLPHYWTRLHGSDVNVRLLNVLRGLYGAFLLHSFAGPVTLSYIRGERFRIIAVLVVSFSGWAIVACVRSLYTNSLLDSYVKEDEALRS
jgi:hypothetical protein